MITIAEIGFDGGLSVRESRGKALSAARAEIRRFVNLAPRGMTAHGA